MGYGAAANVVGGIMQAVAASQAQRAMYRAFAGEMARQGRYRGEAVGSFGQWAPTLGRETAEQEIGQGQASREGAYATGLAAPIMQGAVPAERDKAYYSQTGRNRARLSAYGDWQAEQGRSAQREGWDLGKITNFAQGDAQVFPYQMYKAQHSMDELAFWGQLISSIGGGATNFQSLFGAPPPSGQANFSQMGQAPVSYELPAALDTNPVA
jgi:hypothetical protein